MNRWHARGLDTFHDVFPRLQEIDQFVQNILIDLVDPMFVQCFLFEDFTKWSNRPFHTLQTVDQ